MSTIRAPYEIFLTRGRAGASGQDDSDVAGRFFSNFRPLRSIRYSIASAPIDFPTGAGFLIGACVSLQLAGR